MKRDMELIRKILFYIEDNYNAGEGFLRSVVIDGYDNETVNEHILLAYEAGLIQNIKNIGTLSQPMQYFVGNLSNEGYDLLDKIREDNVWNKTKTVIKEKGLPLMTGTIKTIATAFITATAEGVANSIMKNGGIL